MYETSLEAPCNGVLIYVCLISALCWVADSVHPHDVLINGMKRGVPPKHRHNPKFRSELKAKNIEDLTSTKAKALLGLNVRKYAFSSYIGGLHRYLGCFRSRELFNKA